MMPSYRKKREGVAYHEAGHAVAAVCCGRPITVVSTHHDANRAGHCDYLDGIGDGCPDWRRDQLLRDVLLIGYAGIEAEIRRFPHRRWGIIFSDHTDIAEAEAVAGELAEIRNETLKQVVEDWWKEARELVRDEWLAVRAVATALLECEELTGDEVKQIMEAATT